MKLNKLNLISIPLVLIILLIPNEFLSQTKGNTNKEKIVYQYFQLARDGEFTSLDALVAPESIIANNLLSEAVELRIKLNKQRGVETTVGEIEEKHQKSKANYLRSAKGRRNVIVKEYPKIIHQYQLQIEKINLILVDGKEILSVVFGNNELTITRDFYLVLAENGEWQIYNMEKYVNVKLVQDENGEWKLKAMPNDN